MLKVAAFHFGNCAMENRKMLHLAVLVSFFTRFGASTQVFPEIPPAIQNSNNILCNEHSDVFLENLKNTTLWAYEMWESTAKSPTGVLSGNTYELGHFDECLNTKAPFPVQYCLLELKVHFQNINRDKYSTYYNPNESVFNKFYFTGDRSRVPRNILNLGFCLPASCTSNDIEDSLNRYFQNFTENNSYNLTYSVKIDEFACTSNKEEQNFNIADIIFCVIMIALFLLVFIFTMYDLRRKNDLFTAEQNSFYKRLGLSFSIIKNISDLSKKDDSNPALDILYGLRTFAIFMIIIDHRCGTFIVGPVFNRNFVENHFRSFASLFIFHGDLFVDSFFLLSGLLVTYTLLISFDKRKISPLLIIFNRYIRLTPIYMIVVFFYATLLYKTGSGPLWNLIIGNMQADCRDNWWTAILYISNYVNDDRICMVHSWYLPCDFHFFVLAIPIIMLIQKKPRIGLGVLLIAFIIAILIPFSITFYYKRPALLHFYQEFLIAPKIHPDFRLTYTKSHTRAATYIIGMFTGYIYYKLRNSTIKLSLVKSTIMTGAGLMLMFGGMTSGGIFYNPYHEYNALEAAIYASLHRPAWVTGSAILLLNASYGRFGLMKAFLEWEVWIPLSKLVYGAYLIHMCWQLRYAAMAKVPFYFDELSIITQALGDIFISFLFAFILYLTVEAPFRNIFRVLMLKNRQPSEDNVKISKRRQSRKTENIENSQL